MGLVDRLTTIAVTATLTSAVWIVAGGNWIEQAREASVGQAGAVVGGASAGSEAGAVAAPARGVAGGQGGAQAGGPLLLPVDGVASAQLIDTFNQTRDGGERVHDAIDIMAPRGTGVRSAAPGTVERLFLSEAGGNTVYVRSADKRRIFYYAHLDQYAPGLVEGQTLAKGQRLGTVGSTGNADPAAPHLHFAILQSQPQAEWWEPTTAINPYPLLGGR